MYCFNVKLLKDEYDRRTIEKGAVLFSTGQVFLLFD